MNDPEQFNVVPDVFYCETHDAIACDDFGEPIACALAPYRPGPCDLVSMFIRQPRESESA
jgi:hypothetical protein